MIYNHRGSLYFREKCVISTNALRLESKFSWNICCTVFLKISEVLTATCRFKSTLYESVLACSTSNELLPTRLYLLNHSATISDCTEHFHNFVLFYSTSITPNQTFVRSGIVFDPILISRVFCVHMELSKRLRRRAHDKTHICYYMRGRWRVADIRASLLSLVLLFS